MILMGAMAGITVILGGGSSAVVFDTDPAKSIVLIQNALEQYHLNKVFSERLDKLQLEVRHIIFKFWFPSK